jgi:hypothetical protein
MGEIGNVCQIVVMKPEVKSPSGRCRHRCDVN